MKKSMHYRLIAWFLAAFIALMPSLAVAHSGRTDANGGHFNRETGEYHYHGGNGSSGGDSNSSSSRKNKKSNKSKKSNSDKKDTKKRNTESIIGNKNNTNSSAEKKRSTWEHVKEIPCEITLEWELKLYEKPDSKSRIIGTVMQGSKVVLERETRYFYRVKADGVSGYLRKREINAKITVSIEENKDSANGTAKIILSVKDLVEKIPCETTLEWELNLYKKPDSKSKIIGTVKPGSKIVLERETRYFYQVRADGVSGYLRKKEINAKITESLQ